MSKLIDNSSWNQSTKKKSKKKKDDFDTEVLADWEMLMFVHCIEAISVKEIKKWVRDIVREKTDEDEQQRQLETQMVTETTAEETKVSKTVKQGIAASFMSYFSNQTDE